MGLAVRWIAASTVVLLAGCSAGPVSPTIHESRARGVVTLNGRPLSRGTVTFLPTTKTEGRVDPGIARIEPDGSFWIGNANLSKPAGLKPGRYKVTVLVMEPRAPGESGSLARLAIPEKYTSIESTPFTFDVVKGQNRFRLDMTTNE
ncbi:hypothetical protein K2X85_18025 [bacterium]|jgi:hypothetical protein|nr:hypothetical protein [bacterium]